MKLKSKGGWFDEVWNPITGTPRSEIRPQIKTHCQRFCGDIRFNKSHTDFYDEIKCGHFVLKRPIPSKSSEKNFLIAPFGTSPTFHEYRLETPKVKYRTGRNLYVNCFADTFDMPTNWIDEVFWRIKNNSRHNFILISDNRRMIEEYVEFRPYMMCDNLWIGFRVTERTAKQLSRLQIKTEKSHFFIDIDEVTIETVAMLENFVNTPGTAVRQIEWMLVGVNENTSKNLLIKISKIADNLAIPVFFDTEGADLPRDLPEEFNRHKLSDKKKALTWAKCGLCGLEQPKAAMYRIGWTKGRGCSSTILGFLCEGCFEEYKKHFQSI